MPHKLIIPLICFVLCTLWVKPLKKPLPSFKLMPLLLVDTLAFAGSFNLNFYKIYALLKLKFIKEVEPKIKYFALALIGLTFLSGIIFILIHPELKDPQNPTPLNHPLIRMLRSQFTLVTAFIMAYFVYGELSTKPFREVFKPLEIIGALLAVAIMIEIAFRVDLYGPLTGGHSLVYGTHYFRGKGLSYEPRGAAQALSFCIIALLFYSRFKKFFLLQILFYTGLFLTASMSGIIMIGAINVLIIFRAMIIKNKDFLLRGFTSLGIYGIIFLIFMKIGYLQTNIKQRAFVFEGAPSYVVATPQNSSFIYKILNRLEVFDGAYMNFLVHRPGFFLIGTGSGMGGFASQNYVLEKDIGLFPKGSSTLPLMGGVYLLAQFGGVLSLLLLSLATRGLILTRDNDKFFLLLIIAFFLLQHYYFLPFFIAILYLQFDKLPFFPKRSPEPSHGP